jgi:hypothetical protein
MVTVMVMAMILAHLVGDYVLQWDALAQWKSRELRGVIAHSIVLFAVTALFAAFIDPTWWWGVLFISVTHFLVDAAQFYFRPPIPPLLRFLIDQFLHFLFILIALLAGGYLVWGAIWPGIVADAQSQPLLTALVGYVFITMPTWVLLKFVVYGLVKGQPPDFPAGPSKYVGITERVLITTLVLFGQILLVPLVALPRLMMEWPRVVRGGGDVVYVAELISSVVLAVAVGLGLSALSFA